MKLSWHFQFGEEEKTINYKIPTEGAHVGTVYVTDVCMGAGIIGMLTITAVSSLKL